MTGEPRDFSPVAVGSRVTQGASCVAPVKSNLHSICNGELGIALNSLQGK